MFTKSTNLKAEVSPKQRDAQSIAIVGAGWYGCHLAIALKKAGKDVTLFEKNPSILSEISGSFGIRLHAGPHYPRSKKTRESCRRGFKKFQDTYPELVVPHEHSFYAHGMIDADKHPSKVSNTVFKQSCRETEGFESIKPDDYGFQELSSAYRVEEPSIVLGERLRNAMLKHLQKADVKVIFNYNVSLVEPYPNRVVLSNGEDTQRFDKMINATSYKIHQPEDDPDFPFQMEVFYQPCLALMYRDKTPGQKPISFIVMDGSFPCIMPHITEIEPEHPKTRNYILTHGKWTIMGAYETPEIATAILGSIDDDHVKVYIQQPSEAEMCRFWPEFSKRFEYIGWKGHVLAKIKTEREFRSAVTFERDNIIQIVPGKVSNVFDVEEEVLNLLENKKIMYSGHYRFIKGGVLDQSQQEISEKPSPHLNIGNSASIGTYSETQRNKLYKDPNSTYDLFYPAPQSAPPLFFNATISPRRNPTSSRGMNTIDPTFLIGCIGAITVASVLIVAVLSANAIISPTIAGVLSLTIAGVGSFRFFSHLQAADRTPAALPSPMAKVA